MISRLNEENVLVSLFASVHAIDQQFAPFLKSKGLSESSYNVLRILRGAGMPIPSQTIAERLINKRPDITRLVDRLIRDGLVNRKRCDKDRRVVYIAINERGLDLLKSMDDYMRETSTEILSCLSDEDCKLINDLAVKIQKHLS